MKIVIIPSIAIVLLSLISSSMANTLVLSNNKENSSRIACLTCQENFASSIAECVVPGNETSIVLPDSATSVANSPQVLCVGTYDQESHGFMHEKPYFVYDSRKDYENYRYKCVVNVNDTGFYRSDEEKKVWEQIFPRIWLP